MPKIEADSTILAEKQKASGRSLTKFAYFCSKNEKNMYERKIPVNWDCGIEVTLTVIGGKWRPWLINRIREGHHRPMELQRAIPAATKRVLTQQLNELESMGVVYKKIYAVIPARVEYYLTDFGQSLLPIIDAMDLWGQAHCKTVKSNFCRK